MHNLINAAHELCSANSFPFHSCLFVIDRLSLVVVTIITFMWGLRKGVSSIFILALFMAYINSSLCTAKQNAVNI